jgi:hypothetical protein
VRHRAIGSLEVSVVGIGGNNFGTDGDPIEESDLDVALFMRDPVGQLLELPPGPYRASLPPKPGSER